MKNPNLSLFPEEYPEREYYCPTLEPDEPIEPETAEIPEALGSDFVIKKCRCRQLLLVDPAFAHLNLKRDLICECCNPGLAKKYLNYLKMNL
jgi:hypothetical protein